MLLSSVSVLVVAQSSSENPEGLMDNPVLIAFPLQQWLHERTSMLRYMYSTLPILLFEIIISHYSDTNNSL